MTPTKVPAALVSATVLVAAFISRGEATLNSFTSVTLTVND